MATEKVEVSVKDSEPVIRALEMARTHNERIKAAIEKIVCTEGCDEGVILLDHEGKTDYDPVRKCQVYRNEFFSPLGEAMIKLYRLVSMRCENCNKKLGDEELGQRICELCSSSVDGDEGFQAGFRAKTSAPLAVQTGRD